MEYLREEFTKLKDQFDSHAKETNVKVGDLDVKCQQIDSSVTILSKTVFSDLENMKQQVSKLDKELLEVQASSSEAKDQFDNHAKENKDKFGDLDAKCHQIDTSVTIVSSGLEIVTQKVSKLDKEIQEVQASSSEAKDQFDNHAMETKDRFGDLDAKCHQIDTSVTIVSSGLENVKQQLSKLDKEIQEVKANSSEATKAADQLSAENMESDISKLRDELIKAYMNLRCVQLSPIFEKRRCNIDNIYVDLVIKEKKDSRNTEDESKYVSIQYKDAQSHSNQTIKVTSYKQIFMNERGSKFKRVYLHGKGGFGKTTFCRKVLHAWCNAHEGRPVAQDGSFQDEVVLKMFDLLFYMNLREVSIEENSIEVICAQFPLEEVPSKNTLGALLKHNGDKVLFILDGLDEMIVKARFIENVLTRRVYPNCCFLVSSRPWKISQMELHEGTEIDLLLYLKGFSKENAKIFAKKIFLQCYKDGCIIEQFEKAIEKNKLATHLIHVPLLLLFLVQVWYENERSLPSKLHELYILFLNLMADRIKEKYKTDPNHRQMRFTLGDTQSSLPSKISETSLFMNFGEGFLLSLCEVAHHFLLSSEKENSLVFEETKFVNALGDRGKEKLDVALDLGILSVTDSVSYLNRKTNVSFLHKTMQEFFTALCLIFSPLKLANFISSIADLNDVQQNENIIVFLVGLMPKLGNRVLEKVNELCSENWEKLRSGDGPEMARYRLSESGVPSETFTMLLSMIHRQIGKLGGPEMYRYRLFNFSNIYLGCKEEVIADDELLNVSGLCLQQNDFDPHPWNPDFLQNLYLTGSEYTHDGNNVLVDLRGLKGLIYLRLQYLNCELYLPESDSLSILIMETLTLSTSCCDVLGRMLTHFTKLERLRIDYTDLHNCLLDLTNMTELRVLNLSEETLSSSCCDVLGRMLTHCTKPEKLSICDTNLHNCLLDFSNMMELTVLNLSEVTLSGCCCDVIGSTMTHCPKLETLNIRDTNLHNCLLDFSNATELTVLFFLEVTLSSNCCDVLGSTLTHCTKLKTLSICKTDLNNCLLDLSNMTELTILNLSEVALCSSCCDVLSSTMAHCTKLERVNIDNLNLHFSLLDICNMT